MNSKCQKRIIRRRALTNESKKTDKDEHPKSDPEAIQQPAISQQPDELTFKIILMNKHLESHVTHATYGYWITTVTTVISKQPIAEELVNGAG